jgi:peroxiredoxin
MILFRSRLLTRQSIGTVALLLPVAGWTHQAGPDLVSRLEAAVGRQEKAAARYAHESRAAANGEGRAAAKARYEREIRKDLQDLVELAGTNPSDRVAFRALQFVVTSDIAGSMGVQERAIGLLARDHVGRPRSGNYCQALTNYFYSPAAETFMRAVLERNPEPEQRAIACYSLATLLRMQARFARHLRTHPDQAKTYQAEHGADAITRFIHDKDADAAEKEAEALLERVVNEFGDVPRSPHSARTLGEVAAGNLNEMRRLNVGQTAPEIDGADVEGKRFKLSDFRAKVVLLVFSGEWCRPCVEMYPLEQALLARYRDRAFAVVSVNTDTSRETLKRSISAGKVTWPCWWDGGTDGPIATRWGIMGYPDVYIIDPKGVIRYKNVFGEALERAVDELMMK